MPQDINPYFESNTPYARLDLKENNIELVKTKKEIKDDDKKTNFK